MSEFKNYNLIFSLGEACSCTELLRHHNLQVYSYPFDWLFGSDFIGRCTILGNKFKNFMEIEYLEYSYEEKSINYNAYYNKYNNLTFNHDFPKDIEFYDAFKQVKNKYDRRIERLLKKIEESKSILIVYLESPTTNHSFIENEKIIKGFDILEETFGNKINLLYIRYDKNKTKTEILKNNKITKVSLDYKNYDSNLDFIVKKDKLKYIFSNYKLDNL